MRKMIETFFRPTFMKIPHIYMQYSAMSCFKLVLLSQAGLIFWPWLHEILVESPLEKIQLKHLILPFFMLGVGTAAAILLFICELWRGKRKLV